MSPFDWGTYFKDIKHLRNEFLDVYSFSLVDILTLMSLLILNYMNQILLVNHTKDNLFLFYKEWFQQNFLDWI